jgi:hypothetical protein
MRSIGRLAEALTSSYDLFAIAERVFLLSDDGQLLLLNHERLRGIIDRAFAAVQLVQRDGRYEKDLHRLDLSRQDLADVMSELLKIIPAGPAHLETKKLTSGQADEIKLRLLQGEPVQSVAAHYGVSIEQVKGMRQAA